MSPSMKPSGQSPKEEKEALTPPGMEVAITNVSIGPTERATNPKNATPPLTDLPSAYLSDPVFGLLHLPRFIKKIRHQVEGTLPASYQKNFTKGFDGLLCLHLGIEPGEVIEIVENSKNEAEVYQKLKMLFPEDIRADQWNRMFVQMGLTGERKQQLEEIKSRMGLGHRNDILTFADLIEYDEGRI